jgi:hypothetical protein
LLRERKKKRRLHIEGPVTGGKTNFDLYLEEQLRDPGFAERFEEAGEAWDIALQSTLRRRRQGNLNCLEF